MWKPAESVEPINRLIVTLEQLFLAVLRGSKSAEELVSSPELDQLLQLIDQDPYQAVCMARIKSGHTMTPRHGINVLLIARAWCISMHKLGKRLTSFSHAALLHDLGHWRPDKLVYVFEYFSKDEFQQMQKHTTVTQDELPLSDEAKTWIAQHHEQVDGRGYPNGIDTPHILAQVIRIVDIYDGLTTPRRFRPAHTPHIAMKMMARWADKKFDEGLFLSFQEFMGGSHPFGSYIRLKNGPLAATLPFREGDTQQCLLISSEEGDPLTEAVVRDMTLADIKGEGYHWQQMALPEEWRNLRPDLLNLPRFYS